MHEMPCALVFARDSAGKSRLARMAMMAITTNNSMSVNPCWHRLASHFLCPGCFEVFIKLLFDNRQGCRGRKRSQHLDPVKLLRGISLISDRLGAAVAGDGLHHRPGCSQC